MSNSRKLHTTQTNNKIKQFHYDVFQYKYVNTSHLKAFPPNAKKAESYLMVIVSTVNK